MSKTTKLLILLAIYALLPHVKCEAQLPDTAGEQVTFDPPTDFKGLKAAIMPVLKHATGGKHTALRDYLTKNATGHLAVRSDVNIEDDVHPLLINPRQIDPLAESTTDGVLGTVKGVLEDTADAILGAVPAFDGNGSYGAGERKLGGGRKHRRGAPTSLVPSTNHFDNIYFTNLNLGTPGTFFSVVIDTGSADLWVPATTCTSAVCKNRRRYNPANSKTAVVTDKVATVRYGLGSATGKVAQDTARFGGLEVQGQVFIIATSMNNHQPDEVD
ncbi:hypothetical protein HK104_004981, partial [Borealophlyctis nickersoniae]